MRRPRFQHPFILALAAVAVLAAPRDLQARQSAEPPATVVYLVRHAETTDAAGGDAPLSAQGQARAALLARTLADAGVTRVFTTPYRRTTGTAEAVAAALALDVERYDPRSPGEMLAAVRGSGRSLVVGHSNTIPDLVAALGGTPGEPISEHEHDRLYVLVLHEGGTTTTLLRFGAPPTDSGDRVEPNRWRQGTSDVSQKSRVAPRGRMRP
ncbi:MAG: phosphoglycerate mutase family protein, partial [Gemmatimonadota bacterium]